MSNEKKSGRSHVEAQPIKPLPMPEYQYQHYPPPSKDAVYSLPEKREDKKLDLSGVCLNFK